MPTKRQTVIGATSAAVMAAAVALIQPWEGLYTKPYFDIGGVKTVCYGETAADAVDLNRTYTKQECADLLKQSLVKYDVGLKACLSRDIPDSMHVAFISATYNIGVKGFCGSSMARLANEGRFREACDALLNWNRAGGREIRGLTNRRNAERAVCLKDVI
jgi:lysozyme